LGTSDSNLDENGLLNRDRQSAYQYMFNPKEYISELAEA